jgi:hypothetical protein
VHRGVRGPHTMHSRCNGCSSPMCKVTRGGGAGLNGRPFATNPLRTNPWLFTHCCRCRKCMLLPLERIQSAIPATASPT